MTVRLEPAAPYEVEHEDVVYARPDGVELVARVYRPVGALPSDRPALVDVHGGTWRYFDRKVDAYYDRALAACGMVVVALDFRQAPDHRWPSAAEDVAAGVRWVRRRPLHRADGRVHHQPPRYSASGVSLGLKIGSTRRSGRGSPSHS